ncbi:MAG: flagellar basal body-associated FliL family protein [Dehalococcoidia bacterium]
MFKDKKVLAGGAVLFAAAFWFYIKPNYMDAKPAPVYTQEQIDSSPHPTVILGREVTLGHTTGNAPEGLVLNLKAPASAPNYVKTIIALEFELPDPPWIGAAGDGLTAKNIAFTHDLEHEMPKILDAVATVFGSHTADEVASVEGRDELKVELIDAINEHLSEHKVEAIYFEVFITQ